MATTGFNNELMLEKKEFMFKIAMNDKIMKKVYEKLESLNSDEQIIGLYDAEKEEERIRQTQILGAKRDGQKEKAIEIAKNMDIHLILELTNLITEETESLFKNLEISLLINYSKNITS